MRGHQPIRFESVNKINSEIETMVRVFFVDVANIEDSLMELQQII